jgi:hypothetical protein
MNLRFAALVLLAFTLSACGSLGASPGGTGPASDPSDTAADDSPGTSASAPEGIPDAVWAAILADLERETGGPSDPEVVSAEAVTWNDGSLGCPEAGQAYTQALVDGYHVILEIDGERYDYRVGSGTSVKLCDGGPLEGGG